MYENGARTIWDNFPFRLLVSAVAVRYTISNSFDISCQGIIDGIEDIGHAFVFLRMQGTLIFVIIDGLLKVYTVIVWWGRNVNQWILLTRLNLPWMIVKVLSDDLGPCEFKYSLCWAIDLLYHVFLGMIKLILSFYLFAQALRKAIWRPELKKNMM